MGASISRNTVNSMIQNSINIYNQYAQTCEISGDQAQNTVKLGPGCNIKNSQLIVDSQYYVNQICMQDSTTTNAISQSISQAMQQSAEAVVQQFSFLTFADAEQFLNLSQDLAQTISTSYNQTCKIDNNTQQNQIICNGASVDNSIIKINSFQNLQQSCVLKTIDENKSVTNLVNKLQQSATAKQADTFGVIIGLFLLGLFGLAAITIYAANTPLVFWIVIILVLVSVGGSIYYTLTAKSNGNYPYKKN